MAGFYKSFKDFQNYYCEKFGRQNPLPWQDGMQAIIWWITEGLPENTRATLTISNNPTGVKISGKGTDDDPYIWAFNINNAEVPTGPQGPQGPAGQDGTIVVANPAETGTTDLTKIKIGNIVYNITSGGSELYQHNITLSVAINFSLQLIVLSTRGTQYTLNDLQGLREIRNFVCGYFSNDGYDHAYVLTNLVTPLTTSDIFTVNYLDASNFYIGLNMAMSEDSYIYDNVIQL